MTIDVKKIISNLSVPLEDEEWEKLKKEIMELMATLLVRSVISLGCFSNAILKNKNYRSNVEGMEN